MLLYYAHAWGGDPTQLDRARARCNTLRAQLAQVSKVIVWAPWIEIAQCGTVSESDAWRVIAPSVAVSTGLFLDLDGRKDLSPGMRKEQTLAWTYNRLVFVANDLSIDRILTKEIFQCR